MHGSISAPDWLTTSNEVEVQNELPQYTVVRCRLGEKGGNYTSMKLQLYGGTELYLQYNQKNLSSY